MLHTRKSVDERDTQHKWIYKAYSIWKQVMCSPQGKPLDLWDVEDVYYFVEANFSVEVTVKFKRYCSGLSVYILAILFSCHFVVSVIIFINLIHKMVLSIYPY